MDSAVCAIFPTERVDSVFFLIPLNSSLIWRRTVGPISTFGVLRQSSSTNSVEGMSGMISFYMIATYLLSKMLTMSAPMDVHWQAVQGQEQVLKLELRGYRPCPLPDRKRNQRCRYGACCRALSKSAMLSCSQPLIGSLTEFSYLSSSWVVTGVVPGLARIDASGAVVGDRSRRFTYEMVRFLRPRLAEPFLVSVAGRWIVLLLNMLKTRSHSLIYRANMR